MVQADIPIGVTEFTQRHTSTMVVLAALHMGWLKFLAVLLKDKTNKEVSKI